MKHVFAAAVLMALAVTGCTATRSTVREFDAAGNLTRETITTESVAKEITASTQGKTVIAWENGWAAYLSASTATTDDPTPTVKMWAGKAAKGVISARPDQQDWDGIARTIAATREDLTVTPAGIETSAPAE